ncbi:MAG: MFS transporter [Burkholderiales bacterium]
MRVRRPAWALSGYYLAYFAYVGAYSPYITLYMKDIGLAATQIGVLYAIPQVMRMFGPALWGSLADRRGSAAPLLRLAAALALVSFCGLYLGDSFAWLFLVFVAFHFFTSGQMPMIEAITLNHVRDAPGRYGRIRVWGSIGFLLSVLGVGAALDIVASTVVLHVTAALLAVTALVAWWVPRTSHGASPGTAPDLRTLFARRDLRAFFAASFCNAVAHAALYTFYSLHLSALGYDKTVIGLMWAVGVIVEIGVFQCWPWIARRFAMRDLYAATFVIGTLRFAMIAWGGDWWWILVAAQVMHAATFAVYHGSAVALIAQSFGATGQGRGQGLYTAVSFGFGGSVGALVAGALWDRVGAQWTFSLSALACLMGVLVLSGARGSTPARSMR